MWHNNYLNMISYKSITDKNKINNVLKYMSMNKNFNIKLFNRFIYCDMRAKIFITLSTEMNKKLVLHRQLTRAINVFFLNHI